MLGFYFTENNQSNLSNRTNEILNWYSLFDAVPERQKISGNKLLTNLKNQVDGITGFFDKIAELSGREGVGAALVEEIKKMGPKAMDELDALLSMSSDKLAEYAALYEQKSAIAQQYAIAGMGGLDYSTANVDFSVSAVGQSSAAMINSMGGGEDRNVPVIPLTINLLTGDARPFAEWILSDLISVASARGTPIAGQQYA